MIGLGVMIRQLGGNKDTVEAVQRVIGNEIASYSMVDDKLQMRLADGSGFLIIQDNGQSCCENRYMSTDDDLGAFDGSVLQGLELRDAPDQADDDGYDEHDVQFLLVTTSKGVFTMSSHNEHNGYYGGFSIEASFKEAARAHHD